MIVIDTTISDRNRDLTKNNEINEAEHFIEVSYVDTVMRGYSVLDRRKIKKPIDASLLSVQDNKGFTVTRKGKPVKLDANNRVIK